jgi:hypothetical protein
VPEKEETPGERQSVAASADDLASLDLESALKDVDRVHAFALQFALIRAAEDAEQRGAGGRYRGYRLLAVLCGVPLRAEDPAEAWGPRFEQAEQRCYRASDFRGEQNDVLAAFAPSITHPALRARVADIAWYNDRRRTGCASVAIEAYCEIINERLSVRPVGGSEEITDSLIDLADYLTRAVQILALTGKRREAAERLGPTFDALYRTARNSAQYVAFDRIARIGLEYDVLGWEQVAVDAEDLAKSNARGQFPMAVKLAWDLATQGYGKLGKTEDKRRCQSASVDETLVSRDAVPSPIAKAHWTRKAIGELRTAGGFGDRIAKLRTELRDLEQASVDEYRPMFFPIDIGDEERDAVAQAFDKLTLPQALLRFAFLASSLSIEKLKEQAQASRKNAVLGSLMATSHADKEGRVIARTPATAQEGDADGDWYKSACQQYLDLWRTHVVAALIEPARVSVMMRFPVEDRHFMPIAIASPFVPDGHEYLFALGFARFWQGDFASAAHILIPQLENSLRFVLLSTGVDSSKIKPDLLQEDRSLRGLLEALRTELEERFGADLINEIDLLFNFRPGPALRHEMAHGKMTVGACYHSTTIYACWLIYRLVCRPLAREWESRIAPGIDAVTA